MPFREQEWSCWHLWSGTPRAESRAKLQFPFSEVLRAGDSQLPWGGFEVKDKHDNDREYRGKQKNVGNNSAYSIVNDLVKKTREYKH